MLLFQSAPKSICVLRLSAIGDVCNAIAAIQLIQKQWPETEITWIAGKIESQFLKDVPNINVITFDKSLGWKGYRKIWKALRHTKFDALLHMQNAMRASIVSLGIKAKYRLGFDNQRSSDLQNLFTNFKVPSPAKPHVLDGFLAFTKALGVEASKPTWSIPISDENARWAKEHLADTKNLLIVPGASKAYKNWNSQGYIDVIQHAHKLGWNVTLAGSPANVEKELAESIYNGVTVQVSNLVGKSSLQQMYALINRADIVISPDTGPAHMANATGTPVIGLYAHHNPDRTCPYQYRDLVVSVYEDSMLAETNKPLEELSWRSRVKDEQAMNRITSQQVIDMFELATNQLAIETETTQLTRESL